MNRRAFFRLTGLIAAAPTLGLAKVVGVRPIIPTSTVFTAGTVLTASMLNEAFATMKRFVEERTA